jgi:YesN/AraC family two-component response regulator
MNFNELTNKFRFEEVKMLLENAKQYSIEGIGYEVGFASKSSFYTLFKKHTGLTPKDYIRKSIPQN